ncbi:unnamed protein product [Amoebophrya sp. A25]|nr:unnamed protein product [Amoebophrya sp. A25]|eukprot:GSA25T00014055001.1
MASRVLVSTSFAEEHIPAVELEHGVVGPPWPLPHAKSTMASRVLSTSFAEQHRTRAELAHQELPHGVSVPWPLHHPKSIRMPLHLRARHNVRLRPLSLSFWGYFEDDDGDYDYYAKIQGWNNFGNGSKM